MQTLKLCVMKEANFTAKHINQDEHTSLNHHFQGAYLGFSSRFRSEL